MSANGIGLLAGVSGKDLTQSMLSSEGKKEISQASRQKEQVTYKGNVITNGIFHRARRNNFTIFMEIQKTSNSQSNLEKEEWERERMG